MLQGLSRINDETESDQKQNQKQRCSQQVHVRVPDIVICLVIDSLHRGRAVLRIQSESVQPSGGVTAQLVASRLRRLHRSNQLR